MTFTNLEYQIKDAVRQIKLQRPKARNALNQALRVELKQALDQANQDCSVRAILLCAEGETFCSGADLTERLPGAEQDGFVTQLLRNEYNPIIRAIKQNTKPVIAAVDGAAAGIGMSLALACDMLVMSEEAYLYSAFGKISLIPDGGAHWMLIRSLGAKRAFEFIAMSQRLTAKQCLSLGLANNVVSSKELINEALQQAIQLTQQAPLTLKFSKQLLASASELTLDQSLDAEAVVQNTLLRSDDFKEGTEAFFSRREPEFKGQ